MVYCCVPLCKSERGRTKNVTFHEFPSDSCQRTSWLKNISRKDWVPADRSVVCSLHFNEENFKPGLKTKRLVPGAVPTVFNYYPSYMQSSIEKKTLKRKPPTARENITVDKAKKPKVTSNKGVTEFDNHQDAEDVIPGFENVCATTLTLPEIVTTSKGTANSNVHILKDIGNTAVVATTSGEFFNHFMESSGSNSIIKEGERKKPGRHPLSRKSVMSNLKKQCIRSKRLKSQVKSLKAQLHKAKKKQNQWKSTHIHSKILHNILEDKEKNVSSALFLSNQIELYGSKVNRWSETTIRECVILRAKSPKSYEHIRKRGLLKLPSRMTLKRYTGFVTGEIGCTSLIKQRLTIENSKLSSSEKYGSLIFDEMAIKQQAKYSKCLDRVTGFVDLGDSQGNTNSSQDLANRLLCFVFKGLSTFIRIPVAYYFTKQLKSEELHKLILKVIHDVEETGFTVVRVVCDNSSVNTAALKLMCPNKALQPEIQHPEDSQRSLFLSFDYAHIMKNVRSQFLNEKRNFTIDGKQVNAQPLKALYKIQIDMAVKPVRCLTRKHIYPTSLEKMNVKRAVEIFSPPVTAALKFMEKNAPHLGFQDVKLTVSFMEIMYKWFQLHDVSNCNQAIHQRNPNSQQYFLLTDERLEWLEEEFINYIDRWYEETKDDKLRFLSLATYEAMRLTTLSTVKCIRHLLSSGFHFVLTRNLSSDDVESMFSSVRQLMGGNDQTNAAGVIFAFEKILRVGIVSSSDHSNVQESVTGNQLFPSKKRMSHINQPAVISESDTRIPSFPALEQLIACPSDHVPVSVESASKAMIAGFMCRYLQDHHTCPLAIDKLIVPASAAPVNSLIKLQDRGALIYPSQKLTSLVISVTRYLGEVLKSCFKMRNIMKTLAQRMSPLVSKNNFFVCGCENAEHTVKLRTLFVSRLVELFLKNNTYKLNDQADFPKIKKKPLSRKVLKL